MPLDCGRLNAIAMSVRLGKAERPRPLRRQTPKKPERRRVITTGDGKDRPFPIGSQEMPAMHRCLSSP